MRFVALIVVWVAACVAAPRFPHWEPPALTAAPIPRIRIEPATQGWWILEVKAADFWLALPVPASRANGRVLQPVRTRTVPLDPITYTALDCAWNIGSKCDSIEDARATAHGPLQQALDDLRARVGAVGGTVAAETRCFAAQVPDRLWCEADAVASDGPIVEHDPEDSPADPPAFTPTRFALSADGSVTMVGRVPAPGTTVALWYRPIEVGFEVIDLEYDGTGRRLEGVGGTALARIGVRPQLDLLAGTSAAAVAPNGATNPSFAGLFQGFVGASYRSRWQWHMGNAFVQLQVGGARDDGVFRPVFGLHIGLVTPGG
jgi:hypothetical protein